MTSKVKTGKRLKTALLGGLAAGALAFGLLSGSSTPAYAQAVCSTHSEVLKHLGKKYSETPVAMGLASNGGVVEVFSAGDGATWTIVLTMPDGKSCMMAAGEAWESVTKLASGPSA